MLHVEITFIIFRIFNNRMSDNRMFKKPELNKRTFDQRSDILKILRGRVHFFWNFPSRVAPAFRVENFEPE
jgi:hypothetical protein